MLKRLPKGLIPVLALAAIALVLVIAVSVFSACTSTTQEVAKPAGMDKVTLRLDWMPSSYHVWHLGKEKGFFTEQNIDLTVSDGKGSGNTINLVATKAEQFGFADAFTLVKSVSYGAPVKMVSMFFRKNAASFWGLSETGLKKPQDFEGHSIGLVAGEAISNIWPLFVDFHKLNKSKIKEVAVDYSTKDAVVLSKKVDFTSGFDHVEETRYADKAKIDELLIADWGLSLVGHGIVTHVDTIRSNPDLVKRFVAASTKTAQYSMDHVDEVVDAIRRARPDDPEPRDARIKQWQYEKEMFYSKRTAGWILGKMSKEDWQDTYDLMTKANMLEEEVPDITAVFTNDFIPEK